MASNRNTLGEDARNVNKAADLLGLREIDFFRLAYRRWYSVDAGHNQMEKFFTDYMFHETVPPWVRHCAREVINRDGMNMLDPVQFGAGDFRRRSKAPRVGRLFLAITTVLMLVAFLSMMTTRIGFDDTNCPGRYANSFFEQWVYMISGKLPPPCEPFKQPDRQ